MLTSLFIEAFLGLVSRLDYVNSGLFAGMHQANGCVCRSGDTTVRHAPQAARGGRLGCPRCLPAIAREHRIHIGMENVVRVVANCFDSDSEDDFQHLPFAETSGEEHLKILSSGLAAACHHDAREDG